MPIHDRGYRRYAGRRTSHKAWATIAAAGVRTFFGRRAFVALLLLAWLPFLVRTVQIYASANLPQMAFIAPTAETFRLFLDQQDAFVFFVTVFVGAGLIANDRRAKALQIYLSKPLTRMDYVLGKLAILLTFVLLITWAPAVMLLVVQVVLTGSFAFVTDHLYLLPAITLFSLVEAIMVSTCMLALSSLSTNSRFVAILYAALIFFGNTLFGVLRVVTRDTTLSWVAVGSNLEQVGDAIFGMPLRYATPLPLSVTVIVALVGVACGVLERRVRGVEVVV
jgi:ABC-type transport system involved in multi-copper enzyme maturation permease subunit